MGNQTARPAAATSPAPALQPVAITTVESVDAALKTRVEQGRCEKVETAALPDPRLMGMWRVNTTAAGASGLKFLLVLEPGSHLKLRAGFSGSGWQDGMSREERLQWSNDWNRRKKFTKTSVDENDQGLTLEYDLNLEKLAHPSAPAISEVLDMFEVSLAAAAMEMTLRQHLHRQLPAALARVAAVAAQSRKRREEEEEEPEGEPRRKAARHTTEAAPAA
mmetsp:Transcript_66953/g.160349  ORF Transcript_66953/g.160349 Transcript_66953/m.160349 type:complete len:220 (+) Transcript_66953:120-779(+)